MMENENLIKIIDAVSESELTGLKYEEDDVKIHLTKKQGKVQVISAVPGGTEIPSAGIFGANAPAMDHSPAGIVTAGNTDAGQKPEGNIVESPLVGTFYAAPSEDAAPFVSVGDTVKKGQTLAIVEAMKLMNEIESDYDGTIAEIFVENGQAVEYGQPLFRIG